MDQLPTEIKAPAADEKAPIINCHTHIFTGDHVAPLLGKSIIRWPLYYLVNFKWIFYFFRRYYKKADKERFDGTDNLKARKKFEFWRTFRKNIILYGLYTIAGLYLTLQSIDILCHWVYSKPPADPGWLIRSLQKLHDFLQSIYLLPDIKNRWLQVAVILLVILFYRSGRNMLWFIAKIMIAILRKLPGKETKKLIDRYLTIGRFAFHTQQKSTLGDLEGQYPAKTRFVILPMDMEYMDAGKPAISYKEQMAELAEIKEKKEKKKETIYPFVFVDPRRMAAEGPAFFDYDVIGGKIVLKECFIKDYIENKRFSGFKIYPALGYYPFDPLLLPLWKYAEQKGLPVLTHCVRGPMYYRGSKKRNWDYHPILEELTGSDKKDTANNNEETITENKEAEFSPLLLSQTNNEEFSANFTHPMNYACLLKNEFLVKAVEIAYKEANDITKNKLVDIFGFIPSATTTPSTIAKGLKDLKICFGHYGGTDEWKRYFEKDRFNHSAQVIKRPDEGIDFIFKAGSTTDIAKGKPEQLWKFTDWYSLISSLILQHDHVYADISFILHDDALILPLLKETLQNKKLRTKVLFGTDFFVVRNLKSDKQMLAAMLGGLEEKDFDQIARINPVPFLTNSIV